MSDGLEKGLIHKQPRQENLSGYFFEPFNGSSMLSRLWMDNLDKSRRSKFNNGPGYRGMYQADDKLCLGSAAEVSRPGNGNEISTESMLEPNILSDRSSSWGQGSRHCCLSLET